MGGGVSAEAFRGRLIRMSWSFVKLSIGFSVLVLTASSVLSAATAGEADAVSVDLPQAQHLFSAHSDKSPRASFSLVALKSESSRAGTALCSELLHFQVAASGNLPSSCLDCAIRAST